jgi:hypothetical protein
VDGQPACGGIGLSGVQGLVRDGREVEGVAVVQAALAAGQGEQRVDQPFLLLAGFQDVLADRAEGGGGGAGVGEGDLDHGAFDGQRGTQFVGGAGNELALGVEQLMPGRHVADLASMLITTTSSFRST